MGPEAAPVRFRVLLDGQPPGTGHGTDVDGDGNGILAQQRVYQLIRQPGTVVDSALEITFDGSGARVYCVTFGSTAAMRVGRTPVRVWLRSADASGPHT